MVKKDKISKKIKTHKIVIKATADIHTPEELLIGAESYLSSSDSQMMRAVVLESFTALETFVHNKVFKILDNKLDQLLVKWLKEKTKMNFDDRLGILTPIALGIDNIKNNNLWCRYEKAKRVRNQVTHNGKKVSRKEATEVFSTVYDWLAYLGSTVEMELSLLRLKRYIEEKNIILTKESEVQKVIYDYFAKIKKVELGREVMMPNNRRADFILEFGEQTILIEAKIVRTGNDLKSRKKDYIKQLKNMLDDTNISRVGLVVFFTEYIPDYFQKVLTYENGKISIVGIKAY